MSFRFTISNDDVFDALSYAYKFAPRIFHEDDIAESGIETLLNDRSMELSDWQYNFLIILLEQYQKNLLRKKKETPQGSIGYQHACKYLSVLEDLLATLEYTQS